MTAHNKLLLDCAVSCVCLLTLAQPAQAAAKPDLQPASSVAELSTIRGVVKATAQATLASQVQGRISRLPFKEGQRFKKGAVLVALDCSKYEAELASAQAEYRAKRKTYENNLRLAEHHAVGDYSHRFFF